MSIWVYLSILSFGFEKDLSDSSEIQAMNIQQDQESREVSTAKRLIDKYRYFGSIGKRQQFMDNLKDTK